MDTTETRVVLVTTPDAEAARALARDLLAEKLVACGNVIPGVISIFRWEEEVREDPEALLILKAHRDRVESLIERIPQLHAYDVPEVLVLGVESGFEPYLAWVANESRPVGNGKEVESS